jgi:2-iminobutanoate/2-iminopropanoate deaminase
MERRSILKKIAASVVGAAGFGLAVKAGTSEISSNGKTAYNVVNNDEIPLFSSAVKHGDLIFVAGKGAHFEGDIKAHTAHVLNELEKELQNAGSSMDKVLKVNVYLHDLKDYKAMNEVYRGRFGNTPPVRTTVAVYGGVPGDSLVEMDCIAHT